MGDILHGLPAITALRKAHPSWGIDWLVEPRWRALLEADNAPERVDHRLSTPQSNSPRPVVDHLYFAATKAWRKRERWRETLAEIRTLRSALHEANYDAVLDLQGGIRSAILGKMGAQHRLVGSATPREKGASLLYTDTIFTRQPHVIEQAYELAEAIAGDELEPTAPWLPWDEAAEGWAEALFAQLDGPAVLINPGAGWGAKRWPIERYAVVAEELAHQGMHILINTGPGEEALAEAITSRAAGRAHALNCTLAQLIATSRRIALAIAGDTGPLHLACALGKPVVGIFGPTDPSRNGPYGSPFEVLRSPISQRDHRRLHDPEAGLLTIEPEAVLHATHTLLYPDTVSKEL